VVCLLTRSAVRMLREFWGVALRWRWAARFEKQYLKVPRVINVRRTLAGLLGFTRDDAIDELYSLPGGCQRGYPKGSSGICWDSRERFRRRRRMSVNVARFPLQRKTILCYFCKSRNLRSVFRLRDGSAKRGVLLF
jgi:hypothetical protein